MTATLPITATCCGEWARAALAPFQRFARLRQGARARVALALSAQRPGSTARAPNRV